MEHTNGDESLSWSVATIIMIVAMLFTVTTRVLGFDPFTQVFDLFIVYLPTAVLVGVFVFQKLRPSGQTVSV